MTHLYQILGFEKVNYENRQTLSKYKTKKSLKLNSGPRMSMRKSHNKNPFSIINHKKKKSSKPLGMKTINNEEPFKTLGEETPIEDDGVDWNVPKEDLSVIRATEPKISILKNSKKNSESINSKIENYVYSPNSKRAKAGRKRIAESEVNHITFNIFADTQANEESKTKSQVACPSQISKFILEEL